MSYFQKLYREALKHPLWQRKRLIVFDRDQWTCKHCRSRETELQAHHLNYRYGKLPYEYDISELQTLCVECHFKETLLQIFDRYQLQNEPISKLAFAFGNCKGEEGKLESIIDLVYRLSTLSLSQVDEFVFKADLEARKFL